FCTATDCAQKSLGNLIFQAGNVTKTMNWIDDYAEFRSVSSNGQSCCRVDRSSGEYGSVEQLATMNDSEQSRFSTCVERGGNVFANMTSDLEYFTRLLPTNECAMGGGMAHREALSFTPEGKVDAFYIQSFHRTFRNASDHINSIRLARSVCDQFKRVLIENGYSNVEVFPYSTDYVLYDQYVDMPSSTTVQFILSSLFGFIGLMITTLCPKTTLIVALNSVSSTLLILAFMTLMDIDVHGNESRVLRPSLPSIRQFWQIGQDREGDGDARQRWQYGVLGHNHHTGDWNHRSEFRQVRDLQGTVI
ncbi:hypothetical protein PENTCL1PPCAC_27871, partial [Pristionchus entomophagus]